MTVTLPGAEVQRHRKHKILNRVQLLAYKLFFGHLGKFVVIAIYYLLLETMRGQRTTIFSWHVTLPDVKGTWDSLLSASTANGGLVHLMSAPAWDSMRHVVFRGLLEGVLGIVLFQQIGFNVLKYRQKLDPEPSRLDRLVLKSRVIASPYQDGPVTGPQYLFFPVWLMALTIFLGIPLYLGLHYGLTQAAHWSWLEPKLATHPSFFQKFYVGEYDGVIIGIVVGVIASRTYRAYLFDNTMFAARRWVAAGRRPHWWMPWPTRDLIHELSQKPEKRSPFADAASVAQAHLMQRSRWETFLAATLPVVGLGLAIFGFYVIYHIAK